MASGTFEKEIGEVRPGTYINFVDERDYSTDGKESAGIIGSGGGGSKWSLPDYYIGHSADVECDTSSIATASAFDYLVAKEDYCYSGDDLQEVS